MTQPHRAWRSATCIALVLCGLASEAQAIGFQCSDTEFTVLEELSTVDVTVARVDFDVTSSDLPSFALGLPSPARPTVTVVSLNGAPITPIETGQTITAIFDPARARDLWIWDVDTRRLRDFLAQVFELAPNAVASARIEIAHGAPPDLLARMAERDALARRGVQVSSDPLAEALAASVANTSVARRVIDAAAPGEITGGIEDVFARSPRWLRVDVEDGGIVRIDYPTLRAALGDDVDRIDPSSLRLFGARHRTQPEKPQDPDGSWNAPAPLRERPLRVTAGGATFGPADAIVAFLPGASGWSDEFDPDAGPLVQDELSTADRLGYWITWDEAGAPAGDFDAPPLRMAARSAAPVDVNALPTRDVRVRSHFEQNVQPAFGLIEDDWAWRDGILPGETARFELRFDGAIADSVAWIRTRPRMSRPGLEERRRVSTFFAEWEINGSVFATAEWTAGDQQDVRGVDIPVLRTPVPIQAGLNVVGASNTTGVASPRLVVDGFSFTWRRDLVVRGEALDWFVPAASAVNATRRYDVSDPAGRLTGARIFDVTDPWNPVELTGANVAPDGTGMDFDVREQAGISSRYVLVLDDQLDVPVAIERGRPRLLRAEVAAADGTPDEGWEMVILYPEIFEDAALDLVDLRRQVTAPRTTAVDLDDVYAQFGHGAKDPAAIRNYLKFLYEVDRDLQLVLLVGDANRDARGVLPSTDPDFCPTWVQDFWPAEGPPTWAYTSVPFGRDDFFVCFHDDQVPENRPFERDLDLPDVAIGRAPVTTVSEASRFVQRLREYELAPASGPWRNRVILAGDDLFGQSGQRQNEDEHIAEAECVAEKVLPPALDVDKIYLTEYERPTPNSVTKPAARLDFREAWGEGALIVHYIGHGSPQQLADETIFRIEDVPTLANRDRLPLFLAFSCDVAIFDDPIARSMSEQLVLQDEGGAIAAIAAAQVTFSNLNEQLTEAFYTQLYPDEASNGRLPSDRLSASRPLGIALLAGKWSSPTQTSTPGQGNNAKYLVLGDPAMRLRSPEESVALGGALSQSFRSGQELDLTAAMPAGVAGGRWYVEARESSESVRVTYPFSSSRDSVLVYQLDGASFFRGEGDVDGTELALDVRAPAVMRFGERGRLRVLLEAGDDQYVGVVDTVDVLRTAIDSDDAEGPSIALDFGQNARRVQPGSVLVATIEDPSGINVLGSTPANSILYEIGDAGLSVDVTDEFRLDEGSTTRGTVEVPLVDVEPGTYALRMTASDMLGNNGVAEITFEVVPAGVAEIGSHAPVPNPFRASTRFVVDVVSPSGLPADLEIDIRAVDGSPVRTLRTGVGGGGGRVVVPWDGRDQRGDEIANGTYLYIVRARFATEPPVTETSTGRVVIMR